MSYHRRSKIEEILQDKSRFSDEYSKQNEIGRLCPDAGYEIRNAMNMGYDASEAARRIDYAQERREEADREERERQQQEEHEERRAEAAAMARAEEEDRLAYEAQQAEEENARYEAEQQGPPEEETPA